MTWHPDEDLLQDHLEELLPREEEERVRTHLEGCAACRAELRDLSEVMAGLGELPVEAQPSRDLWPQIAWRMGNEPGGVQEARAAFRRRFSLSGWQLLAASLVIALFSGGTVWMVLSGTASDPGYPAFGAYSSAQAAGLPDALADYDQAVTDLEAVLEQGRKVLDEETIKVLEENLNIIDAAILDAQEALALDPASGILQRALAGNLRKKMELLRTAATAVYANS